MELMTNRWESYLIHGVGGEVVACVADLRDVVRDRVIADRAVVAHDEAQQAYLQVEPGDNRVNWGCRGGRVY